MPAAGSKKIIKRLNSGGLNRPGKRVKMIQARCERCNPRGQGKRGWWETCKHDPYHTVKEIEVHHPILETREDGSTIKTGDTIEIEYELIPNAKGIADDPKITSGRMIQIQRERGSKFPEELGYAPVCDFNGCWEPNPMVHANRLIEHEGVQTRVGDYHTRQEAQIVTLILEQTSVYLGVDKDIQRRSQQLDRVVI